MLEDYRADNLVIQSHTDRVVSVYVDQPRHQFGRMIMCHMLADSTDELHAMADRIGIERRWFQSLPEHSIPHYDVCKAKRKLAVRYGAIEIGRHELVRIIRRLRESA